MIVASLYFRAPQVGAYTAAMILFGDVNRQTQEDTFEVGACVQLIAVLYAMPFSILKPLELCI